MVSGKKTHLRRLCEKFNLVSLDPNELVAAAVAEAQKQSQSPENAGGDETAPVSGEEATEVDSSNVEGLKAKLVTLGKAAFDATAEGQECPEDTKADILVTNMRLLDVQAKSGNEGEMNGFILVNYPQTSTQHELLEK